MRLIVLLAATVALAGCLDAVLPDPVLPKTLDLTVGYEGGQEELEGLTYAVEVVSDNGTVIVDESGTIESGTEVHVTAVFETLGPYTITVELSHPSGPSWSRSAEWDFEIVCRAASEMQVSAILRDGDLDWSADSDGKICF